MACSACSANVEKKLNSLPGIKSAAVNLPGRTALVEYNPDEISLEKMKSAINAIGYDLVIETNRSAEVIERRELQRLKRRTLLSWGFALLCMCVSMGWLNLGGKTINNQVALLLALANFVVCGGEFFSRAWRQLRHGSAIWTRLWPYPQALLSFSARSTPFGAMPYGAREALFGIPISMPR